MIQFLANAMFCFQLHYIFSYLKSDLKLWKWVDRQLILVGVCSRQLLVPVQLGGEAISWAAGKLESNGIGLSTSPSSSDVQSRVLQAAAKHESQPSDTELQGPSTESETSSVTENIDISQA